MSQAQQQQPSARQVVVVADGSSYMEPYWQSLYETCLYPALTWLDVKKENQQVRTEFALVTFYEHPPYGDRLLRTNFFTSKISLFDSWARNIQFDGGGYAQNALTEGLAAALELLDIDPAAPNPPRQGQATDKHILLVTNSRPHETPCRLPGPLQGREMAEVLHSLSSSGINLSILLPHDLDPLKSNMKKYFEAAKLPGETLPATHPNHVHTTELKLPELDHAALLRGIQLTLCKSVDRNLLVHYGVPATPAPSQTQTQAPQAVAVAQQGKAIPSQQQQQQPVVGAPPMQSQVQQHHGAAAGQKRPLPVDTSGRAGQAPQPPAKRNAPMPVQIPQHNHNTLKGESPSPVPYTHTPQGAPGGHMSQQGILIPQTSLSPVAGGVGHARQQGMQRGSPQNTGGGGMVGGVGGVGGVPVGMTPAQAQHWRQQQAQQQQQQQQQGGGGGGMMQTKPGHPQQQVQQPGRGGMVSGSPQHAMHAHHQHQHQQQVRGGVPPQQGAVGGHAPMQQQVRGMRPQSISPSPQQGIIPHGMHSSSPVQNQQQQQQQQQHPQGHPQAQQQQPQQQQHMPPATQGQGRVAGGQPLQVGGGMQGGQGGGAQGQMHQQAAMSHRGGTMPQQQPHMSQQGQMMHMQQQGRPQHPQQGVPGGPQPGVSPQAQQMQQGQGRPQQQQSGPVGGSGVPPHLGIVTQQPIWQGDFITIKDGKAQPFCGAIGCAAYNQKTSQKQRTELQNMVHHIFSDPLDRTRSIEIRKFEEASKLPDVTNVCMVFVEQPGPNGAPNETFRKLHVSLTKHNKFALTACRAGGAIRMLAITPDGTPQSSESRHWRLLAVPVMTAAPQVQQAGAGQQQGRGMIPAGYQQHPPAGGAGVHPSKQGEGHPSQQGGVHPSKQGGGHPSQQGGVQPSQQGGGHPSQQGGPGYGMQPQMRR